MTQAVRLALTGVSLFGFNTSARENLSAEVAGAGYRIGGTFHDPVKLVESISTADVDHIILIETGEQGAMKAGTDQPAATARLITEICGVRPLPVVAVMEERNRAWGELLLDAGAQALLIKPVLAKDVLAAFLVATNSQAKEAALRTEINGLSRKLEERKLIERAKGILMDAAKVSEAEAFRLMQKSSQDTRRPMCDIAKSIIATTTLMKDAERTKNVK